LGIFLILLILGGAVFFVKEKYQGKVIPEFLFLEKKFPEKAPPNLRSF